jgi:hypothetical protein
VRRRIRARAGQRYCAGNQNVLAVAEQPRCEQLMIVVKEVRRLGLDPFLPSVNQEVDLLNGVVVRGSHRYLPRLRVHQPRMVSDRHRHRGR